MSLMTKTVYWFISLRHSQVSTLTSHHNRVKTLPAVQETQVWFLPCAGVRWELIPVNDWMKWTSNSSCHTLVGKARPQARPTPQSSQAPPLHPRNLASLTVDYLLLPSPCNFPPGKPSNPWITCSTLPCAISLSHDCLAPKFLCD